MKDLSILCWNVQGKKYRFSHTPFRKILPHLENSPLDILCLTEMCDAETKIKDIEAFKDYNVYIPENNQADDRKIGGYNHNVLLSKYPILSAGELSFSHLNHKRRFENCTKADIKIGSTLIRIYICHFLIGRVGIATRQKQLDLVLSDAREFDGPVIVCGDMNVAIPEVGWKRFMVQAWHREPRKEMYLDGKLVEGDEREVFAQAALEHGFQEILDLNTPTWSHFKTNIWEPFGLKLDWFLVRDLNVSGVRLGTYISDHKPIMVDIALKN